MTNHVQNVVKNPKICPKNLNGSYKSFAKDEILFGFHATVLKYWVPFLTKTIGKDKKYLDCALPERIWNTVFLKLISFEGKAGIFWAGH